MSAPTVAWKTAWVTGASTGIGREIALQLLEKGVRVAASARTADKLASLDPRILAVPLDVTDLAACKTAAQFIETELGPIDLAVLGAGTYSPVSIDRLDAELFSEMMNTNYMGVVNCLVALAPRMLERGTGHLSWIASVAGFMGLPKAAAYGPSKAALINLAESLYPEMKLRGVQISVINPGFVETPLTAQNDFEMPFLMKAEDAARRSIDGLSAGRFEIAYPRRFVAILKSVRALPYPMFFWLIKRAILKER